MKFEPEKPLVLLDAASYGVVLSQREIDQVKFGTVVKLFALAREDDPDATELQPLNSRTGERIRGKEVFVAPTRDLWNWAYHEDGTRSSPGMVGVAIDDEEAAGVRVGQKVQFAISHIFEIVSVRPN